LKDRLHETIDEVLEDNGVTEDYLSGDVVAEIVNQVYQVLSEEPDGVEGLTFPVGDLDDEEDTG